MFLESLKFHHANETKLHGTHRPLQKASCFLMSTVKITVLLSCNCHLWRKDAELLVLDG